MPHSLHFKAEALLLDIEGTISPVSFVRDVLFAYSRARIADYIAAHRSTPAVDEILADTTALAPGDDPVAALIRWQEHDEKAPPLKKLQGLIWESGYRDGAFRSPLFADGLAALTRWKTSGLPLYVYSSGSRQAQDLFFQYNEAGDLRPLFAGHYDTDIGAKTDPASYKKIAEEIGVDAYAILFLSDNPKELEAARAADVQVVHVIKNETQVDARFAATTDFADIEISRIALD